MSAPTLSTIQTITSSKVIHIRADDSSSSKYHPLFSYPDADVTLRSLEGTLYRIHSFTLRATSGFFATMFTLPQPKSCAVEYRTDGDSSSGESRLRFPDALDIYEHDVAVEPLLKLMTGQALPKWESVDDLERVLTIAEKWDTPGPISALRYVFSAKYILERDALRCYVLARHFGWDAESRLASTHTLTLDLHSPIHAANLERLSSVDLLRLIDLHRKRRDMFRDLLNSPERFAAGNSSPYHCNRCGVTVLENHPWRELKHAMFLEIEKRPLGDTLGLTMGAVEEWPVAKACWEARCTKEGCGGLNYDRVATLRQIRSCIALLPVSIEL